MSCKLKGLVPIVLVAANFAQPAMATTTPDNVYYSDSQSVPKEDVSYRFADYGLVTFDSWNESLRGAGQSVHNGEIQTLMGTGNCISLGSVMVDGGNFVATGLGTVTIGGNLEVSGDVAQGLGNFYALDLAGVNVAGNVRVKEASLYDGASVTLTGDDIRAGALRLDGGKAIVGSTDVSSTDVLNSKAVFGTVEMAKGSSITIRGRKPYQGFQGNDTVVIVEGFDSAASGQINVEGWSSLIIGNESVSDDACKEIQNARIFLAGNTNASAVYVSKSQDLADVKIHVGNVAEVNSDKSIVVGADAVMVWNVADSGAVLSRARAAGQPVTVLAEKGSSIALANYDGSDITLDVEGSSEVKIDAVSGYRADAKITSGRLVVTKARLSQVEGNEVAGLLADFENGAVKPGSVGYQFIDRMYLVDQTLSNSNAVDLLRKVATPVIAAGGDRLYQMVDREMFTRALDDSTGLHIAGNGRWSWGFDAVNMDGYLGGVDQFENGAKIKYGASGGALKLGLNFDDESYLSASVSYMDMDSEVGYGIGRFAYGDEMTSFSLKYSKKASFGNWSVVGQYSMAKRGGIEHEAYLGYRSETDGDGFRSLTAGAYWDNSYVMGPFTVEPRLGIGYYRFDAGNSQVIMGNEDTGNYGGAFYNRHDAASNVTAHASVKASFIFRAGDQLVVPSVSIGYDGHLGNNDSTMHVGIVGSKASDAIAMKGLEDSFSASLSLDIVPDGDKPFVDSFVRFKYGIKSVGGHRTTYWTANTRIPF